jgi:hypothetical protein
MYRNGPMPEKPPMPLWVKGFIAVVVILMILFVGSMLLGVRHGPGMHSSAPNPAATLVTAPR